MYLVISTSLKTDSRSRQLAHAASAQLAQSGREVITIDLREYQLPFCNAEDCYTHPDVVKLHDLVSRAKGILVAVPIYNYDVNAAAKNLVELTGQAWRDKPVGFLCAAGGYGSYMSIMSLANSLMLDFRCIILPRFVYATGDSFPGGELTSKLHERIEELTTKLSRLAEALS